MEEMNEVCSTAALLFSPSLIISLSTSTTTCSYHQRALRTRKHPLAASEDARNTHPSQAGTKRLFSDRVSRLLDASDNEDESGHPKLVPDEIHDEKRSRGSDWPLRRPSPRPTDPDVQMDSISRNRISSPARGSRFVEGSMNDRASKVPPAEFIGENLREAYARSRGRSQTAQRDSTVESATEKTEAARSSGIFRFGKSVAATFNPANWKIWKQPQLDETAQQKALRERQEKAEKVYRELKETGMFRDSAHPPTFHVTHDTGNTVMQDASEDKHDDNTKKHDSGIAFDEIIRDGVTSEEEKRHGRIFLDPLNILSDSEGNFSDGYTKHTSLQTARHASTTHLPPPARIPSPRKLRSTSRATSSTTSSTGSGHRSLSIPRTRRGSTSNITSTALTTSTTPTQPSESEYSSRTSPVYGSRSVHSRSDMKKQKRTQRKLVKRVSDLEVKLATARQELLESGGKISSPLSQSQSQSNKIKKPPTKLGGSPQDAPTKMTASAARSSAPNGPLLNRPEDDDEEEQSNTRITRSRFIPGALPTLPSERLLSGYMQSENEIPDSDSESGVFGNGKDGEARGKEEIDVLQIGRAVSTDYGERRGFEWPDYVF